MDLYLDFVFSAILLLGLVAIYEFASNSIKFPNQYVEYSTSGVALGLMTVIILSNPVHVDKGIFVDTRWVLLSCAAIFLNWRIVIIGAIIGAAYRYYQGGIGALSGVMSIVTAVTMGFLWRWLLFSFKLRFQWYLHYLFAFALEAMTIYVIYLFMPEGKGPHVANIITLPLLTVFPVVSTLLSLLLQHHWKREVLAFD
ncbi:LytS/YhcK type 5TM receptor domain-containing protein [Shewanella sp. YIC-542]|uniref:LytS/YhcK type 5TM receptor domain-containing protein n=1 Tax=Shewanella mytili TaxID=3377111 RepID=UPI00398F57DF